MAMQQRPQQQVPPGMGFGGLPPFMMGGPGYGQMGYGQPAGYQNPGQGYPPAYQGQPSPYQPAGMYQNELQPGLRQAGGMQPQQQAPVQQRPALARPGQLQSLNGQGGSQQRPQMAVTPQPRLPEPTTVPLTLAEPPQRANGVLLPGVQPSMPYVPVFGGRRRR